MIRHEARQLAWAGGAGVLAGLGEELPLYLGVLALQVEELEQRRVVELLAPAGGCVGRDGIKPLLPPFFGGRRVQEEARGWDGVEAIIVDLNLAGTSGRAFVRVQLQLAGCVVARVAKRAAGVENGGDVL